MQTKKQKFIANASQADPYQLTKNRPEYQLFQEQYFSAADIKIFLGDIWIDDAIMVQYTLTEQLLPIYGYASYTYDAMARGQRIVNGAFEINFTSVGYLQQVLANADAIEYAIQSGTKGKNFGPDFFQNTRLDDILTSLGKHSFEQVADEYEKALWGEEDAGLATDLESYFPDSDYGFDLKIYYGPVEAINKYGSKKMYKQMQAKQSPVTVEVINGVQIQGQSKQIATSDESKPITEQYVFQARDLNGQSLSSDRVSHEIAQGASMPAANTGSSNAFVGK